MTKYEAMRGDPARRILGQYAVSFELSVRYGDLDTNAHLNNVSFARFFEEGRVRLHHQLGGKTELGFRPIVANINIDYLAEGSWPAPAHIGAGILRLGNSSYVIAQALFQNDKCIALSDTIMVNRAADRPGGAPLPDRLRAALTPLLFRA